MDRLIEKAGRALGADAAPRVPREGKRIDVGDCKFTVVIFVPIWHVAGRCSTLLTAFWRWQTPQDVD